MPQLSSTSFVSRFYKMPSWGIWKIKIVAGNIDCRNHCTFSGDAMRLCLSFGAILFGILLNQSESQQWISRYQILSTPICEPWCWNYAHQHLPLSKITQFCRFLYTSTMVRIWVILDLQWFSWCFSWFSMDFMGFPMEFSSHLRIQRLHRWVPAPLRASRKVTLRLASSKKLRSESKVNTLHIIYKKYRWACIYIMLYYIILYYVMVYYIMLYYIILYFTILYYIMYIILYSILLRYITLHYILLH